MLEQRQGVRVGWALIPRLIEEAGERPVHGILTDVVLERVHHHRPLPVVDVGLVFVEDEGQLLLGLEAATFEILVHLVLQEPFHLLGSVLVLHDHERRVLRQRLGENRRSLHPTTDHLVRPPLMRDLVGRHVERVVDVVIVVVHIGDEADRFGVRDRVGERLRERRVARELENAQLPVLVRPPMLGVVVQRLLHRTYHAMDIVLVAWVVVDRDIDVVPPVRGDVPLG